MRTPRTVVASLVVLALSAAAAVAQQVGFTVTLDESVASEPYTGRVYVALVPAEARATPLQGMHSWFNPQPHFAVDVVGLEPGGSVAVGPGALHFPTAMGDLPAGAYLAQAIARVNPDSPTAGRGAGDLLSEVAELEVDPVLGWSLELELTEEVPEPVFEQTDRIRLLELRSERLGAFHGREITLRAGVRVPEGFDERRAAGERFPVVYVVTGFGGDHTFIRSIERYGMIGGAAGEEIVWVVPDATNFHGHSVFADSANTGPWARALVEEIAPAVDTAFGGAGPEHRYITGVSSGGWSSLWVQLTEGEHFAGCWSHAPDPVWFGRFQTADIYDPSTNMYVDAEGEERPIAVNREGDVLLTVRDFVAHETVRGPGGQYDAFEAVFGPRSPDGSVVRLFDRESGAIDPDVAAYWKRYDIAHVVRTRWDELGEGLAGKIHVYAGSEDQFLLQLAIPELRAAFEEVGSDAEVRIIRGMGHTLSREGNDDMLATIRARWED